MANSEQGYAYSEMQLDSDELPIRFLTFSMEETWPEEFKRVDAEIRQFALPVVVDLGEGSKTVLLTVAQVGHDGEVMERRRVLLTVDLGGPTLRPGSKVWNKLLGIPDQSK